MVEKHSSRCGLGRAAFLSSVFVVAGYSTYLWAGDVTVLKKVDSPDLRTGIQIEVKEGVDLGGKPGLKLSLTGWAPRADFAIYALDVNGDSVPLVPAEAEQAADGQGRATVAILYETPGLHPGSWIIEVSGKDADRAERLLIPAVVHRKRGWRLDFQAARDWDARHTDEIPMPPG